MQIYYTQNARKIFPTEGVGTPAEKLELADLVVIDAQSTGSDPEDTELLAALDAGIPVLLVRTTAVITDRVAGAPVAGDIVLVQKSSDGSLSADVLRAAVAEYEVSEGEEGQLQEAVDAAAHESTDEIDATAVDSQPSLAAVDTENLLKQVQEHIDMPRGGGPPGLRFSNTLRVRPSSADEPEAEHHFPVNMPQLPWQINWDNGHVQHLLIDMDFDVSVYATNNPDNKFVVVKATGNGISPGTLTYDNEGERGFFLEEVVIKVSPEDGAALPTDFRVIGSSPDNRNNVGQYTVSRGWEVGGSLEYGGGGLSGSYNESTSHTEDLPDFKVTRTIQSGRVEWSFRMAKTTDGKYNEPEDLIDSWDGDIHNVSGIAKNGFAPKVDAVFRVPGNYNGVIPLRFEVIQRVLFIDRWYTHSGFKYKWKSLRRGWKNWSVRSIDFSKVQAPEKPADPATEIKALKSRLNNLEATVSQQQTVLNELLDMIGWQGQTLVDHDRRITALDLQLNPPQPPTLTTHRVNQGESLSVIAYRYYRSATPEKWMAIYHRNKDIIGPNPRIIQPGMMLAIPDLNAAPRGT